MPRNVATCRCGAELPAESSAVTAAAVPEESSGGSPAIVALVVAVLLIGGAGYWFFLRPAPAATPGRTKPRKTTGASADRRGAGSATSAEARAGTPPPRTPRDAAPAADGRRARRRAGHADAAVSASTEEMVDRVMPAVVLIEATGGRGSGFFVRHDTLITNVHVVENDGYVTLRQERRHDRERARRNQGAGVRHRDPQGGDAVGVAGRDSDGQRALAPARPGNHRHRLGARHAAEQRVARHRQRPAHQRRRHAGADRRGGQSRQQRRADARSQRLGDRHHDDGLQECRGLELRRRDRSRARPARRAAGQSRHAARLERHPVAVAAARRAIASSNRARSSCARASASSPRPPARIDAGWKRYRDQCYKSPIPGNYDREWFALLVPRGMPADAGAGCPELLRGHGIRREAVPRR